MPRPSLRQSALLVLLASLAMACGAEAQNIGVSTAVGASVTAAPPDPEKFAPHDTAATAQYVGPAIGEDKKSLGTPDLLFATPEVPFEDVGTIQVTCPDPGCFYKTASAAMSAKAHEVGASGVHSIVESSGKLTEPIEYVARTNSFVHVLRGKAFVASH